MKVSDASSFLVPPVVTGTTACQVMEPMKVGWKKPLGVGFVKSDTVEKILVGDEELTVRLLDVDNFILSQPAGLILLQGASLAFLFDNSFCKDLHQPFVADLLVFSLSFSLDFGLIKHMAFAEIMSSHTGIDHEEVRKHLFFHHLNS